MSNDARSTAEEILGGRYEVLYNGIELNRFSTHSTIEKDGPTILFIGRHEHRKGLDVLIKALDYLPKNVRLWVAGGGPQTAALKAATAGDRRVEWLGRITDTEKAQRLASADVFCAPAIDGESFGIILLEAMASGLPVVASDLPGYRNVGRNEVDALMVMPGDPIALSGALKRVLDDDQLAERLRTEGRKRAETFAMSGLAEKYVELYEKCMSQYPFIV